MDKEEKLEALVAKVTEDTVSNSAKLQVIIDLLIKSEITTEEEIDSLVRNKYEKESGKFTDELSDEIE
ncbi:hypothetical protein [Pseudalkalibacillus caeni]|uniref:Uncharacterized protein n=1 Tax=Exobacillus caeni TaxID=2574798 RepID=A0A5R9F1J7_9BACL|nr:hypothetical protein [Pseudalkalibacillus caeni]TLS36529.1 hypothetical protein FCL54_15055 [Pseudalkalibacillus caeni]